jgi:hypothetical protein
MNVRIKGIRFSDFLLSRQSSPIPTRGLFSWRNETKKIQIYDREVGQEHCSESKEEKEKPTTQTVNFQHSYTTQLRYCWQPGIDLLITSQVSWETNTGVKNYEQSIFNMLSISTPVEEQSHQD